MPGDYAYRTSEDGIPFMQNGFVATVLQLYAQYSPNDRYMETSYGRKPVQQTFPVFTAQYSQGIPGVMDGTLDFQRLDVKIYHAIKTVQLGISSLEIRGGKVWGEVPYSYLFNGRANLPSSGFSDVGLFIADQFSFETMRNNEFLSDQYVQLMFRQNFQSRLLHIKKWKPDVEWMIRGLWGSLQNPELHQGIGVREATGFYETGLEINRIMGTLGVGAYYRFGGLQLEDELSNWSIKLTARFRIIE
jgi:hypothetical protein